MFVWHRRCLVDLLDDFVLGIGCEFALGCEVCVVEEVAEEDEVTGVHHEAVSQVVKRGLAEVATRLDLICPHIDKGTEHHLHNLEGSDGHADGPRDAEAEGTEGVVRVHEGVHCVVHHHEPATRAQVVGVAVPHVDQGGDVMIPMQEDQLLLPQHDEQSVPEFVDFRNGKHKRPKARWSIKVGRVAN